MEKFLSITSKCADSSWCAVCSEDSPDSGTTYKIIAGLMAALFATTCVVIACLVFTICRNKKPELEFIPISSKASVSGMYNS